LVAVAFCALPIPHGLHTCNSLADYRVMEAAAKRTTANPQLEVLLRVRQAGNPAFAFLEPGHASAPFYAHLKQRAALGAMADWPEPHLVEGVVEGGGEPRGAAAMDLSGSEGGGGRPAATSLTRLLAAYGDGSEGDDSDGDGCDAAPALPPTFAPPAASSAAAPPALAPLPPPTTLEAIDKLVQYVVRVGEAFVGVVSEREAANPALAFLQTWSPWHATFRSRLAAAMALDAKAKTEAAAAAAAAAAASAEASAAAVASRLQKPPVQQAAPVEAPLYVRRAAMGPPPPAPPLLPPPPTPSCLPPPLPPSSLTPPPLPPFVCTAGRQPDATARAGARKYLADVRQQLRALRLPDAPPPPPAAPPLPLRQTATDAVPSPAVRARAVHGRATVVVDSDDDGGGWARGGPPAHASSPAPAPAPAPTTTVAAAAESGGDDSDDSETWLDAPVGYAHYATAAVACELGWTGGPLMPPVRGPAAAAVSGGSTRTAGDKRPREASAAAPSRVRCGGDARFADD